MEPKGLEPPLPRQLLVLSCQLSWIKYLCLINGTREPLSRRLLKMKELHEGKRGQEGSWKCGPLGSILVQLRSPDIVLYKDAF